MSGCDRAAAPAGMSEMRLPLAAAAAAAACICSALRFRLSPSTSRPPDRAPLPLLLPLLTSVGPAAGIGVEGADGGGAMAAGGAAAKEAGVVGSARGVEGADGVALAPDWLRERADGDAAATPLLAFHDDSRSAANAFSAPTTTQKHTHAHIHRRAERQE